MGNKLKASIIGFGKMGKIRAEFAEQCNIEIVSVYESNEEITIDKYHRVKLVDEIFDNKETDIIFVSTPNHFNKEYTIRALKNKKHVFCEKPPCINVTEMLEIIEEEKKHPELKLMYGLNHRHHDSVIRIKNEIESGKFGKVLWMRGRYGKNVGEDFFSNWRANAEQSGGGILIDQGIHMLDLFLYFANNFDEIKSMVTNQYWNIDGVEDNVFALLKNTNKNIVASLHSTMTQWRHLFSLEVFLEDGYMTLNGLKTPSGRYGEEVLTIAKNKKQKGGERLFEHQYKYLVDNSWYNEINYFTSIIKNDGEITIGNSDDAYKLMNLIEKIYEDGRC
jgi:predicted dehydrogenase